MAKSPASGAARATASADTERAASAKPSGRRKPAEIDRADREPATPTRAAASGTGKSSGGKTAAPKPAAAPPSSAAVPAAKVAAKEAPASTAAKQTPTPANAEATRMERADIGLTNRDRAGVSGILNRALSDEHVLYIRTRNYHWNVTGMHFKSLHEFFEEQYRQIEIAIDEIAERARSLGFRALGSMTEFIAHTHLTEQNPAEVPTAEQMLRNLLNDHESIIKQLREDIDTCDEKLNDSGTADFLTEKMEEHEKMAWMIRAYLA